MDTDEETAEWFNLLLARFWLIFEPMISEIGMADENDLVRLS